jgi:predicted CXXCH cytochrome family protein
MKTVKMLLRLTVAAALAIGFGKAYAFHSGGVAECGGCHSMHSPQDVALGQLLIATDQSSTCANASCHGAAGAGSYHVVTPNSALGPGQSPYNFTPGGDFGWLKKTYSFVVRGSPVVEEGHEHGHNIVAADLGYASDGTSGNSPGGAFPVTQLHCNSCHDQHGQARRTSAGTIVMGGIIGQAPGPIVASGSYATSPGNTATNPIKAGQAVGVYRLLRGNGSTISGVTFAGVPAAVAPGTYNRAESTSQTRVSYGVATTGGHITWGNWCGTCHGAMHSTGNYVHPVDQSMASLIPNYTNYVSSGDLSGAFTGDHANQGPFLSLAPFTKNDGNYVNLASFAAAGATTATALSAPTNGDQVNCLSCHRAHATAFPWMLRWQMEGEFVTVADTATGLVPIWPGTDNGAAVQFARGRTEVEQRAGYYMRPATVFGVYNRVLCNKCHAKD